MAVETAALQHVRPMVEPRPPQHALILLDAGDGRVIDGVTAGAGLRHEPGELVDLVHLVGRQPGIQRTHAEPGVVEHGTGGSKTPVDVRELALDLGELVLDKRLVPTPEAVGVLT